MAKRRGDKEVSRRGKTGPSGQLKMSARRPGKKTVKGKRAVVLGFVIGMIAILIFAGLYAYIIPRTSLEVRTLYSEGSGGGMTPQINVNVKLTNRGTRDITGLSGNVTVTSSDGAMVASKEFSYTGSRMNRGENMEIALHYHASQLEDYNITINLSFRGHDGSVREVFEHTTHEPDMNIEFRDLAG